MDNSTALRLVIKALNQTGPVFGQVNQSLNKFSQNSQKTANNVSQSFKVAGKSIGDMGKKLMGLSSVATGALAGSAGAAIDFEKKLANISTLISGDSTKAIEGLKTGIRGVAKEFGVAHGELATSAYSIYSAGITDATKAQEALTEATKLSIAGLGSSEQATDLLTSSLNAFASQGLTAEQASSVLFNTVKNGKTDVSQLAQGFGGIAPLMADTGVSFDSFTSAVSAATTVGTPASQVYSQMKAAIAGMTRETELSQDVFGRINETFGTNVSTFKELVDVTDGDLVEAFGAIKSVVGDNDAELLKLVGSTEALNAINSLTSDTMYDSYIGALDGAANAADNLNEAVEKQQETTGAALNRLKTSVVDLGISLGDILLPIIQTVAEKVQMFTDWLNSLDESTQKWIVGGLGAAAAASGFLIVLGKVVSLLGSGISVIIKVTGFLTKMTLAIVKGTAAAIKWGVQATIAVGKWLAASVATMARLAIQTGVWLASHAAMAVATLAAIGPYILLGAAIAAFVILVVKYWDEIVAAIKWAMNWIWEKIIQPIWFLITSYIKLQIAIWKKIIETVIAAVKWVFDRVWNGIKVVWDWITGAFETGVNTIKTIFAKVKDFITAPFKAAFNFVADAWNNTVGKLSFKAPDWVPVIGGKGFSVPKIPKFEQGVRDFQGGLAVVGEAGPEVVALPRGSSVYSNQESQQMAAGRTLINYGEINLNTREAVMAFFDGLQSELQDGLQGLPTGA